MDRRLFLQTSVAAGVVGSAGCVAGDEAPAGDADQAGSPDAGPAGTPGGPASPPTPGERDWTALGRADLKPARPIEAHIRAVSPTAMVSTDHPYATEAALWALERGGTAADAYITAALVQCVVEPAMTTLGGGFGVTFFDAAAGELSTAGAGFAFPSGAPATEPYEEARSWTGFAAMVPGYVRGLETAHSAYGRLPWEDLWEPAIAFAENGFVIDHTLWGYLHHYRKMVGRFAGPGRDNWFRDGYLPGVGETVHLPELAATMTHLRDEGGDYFYTGPFARKLVDEVARRGGGITMDDLAAMGGFVSPAVEVRRAGQRTPYRGYEIAPSSGLLFQLGLQVFEAADLRGWARPPRAWRRCTPRSGWRRSSGTAAVPTSPPGAEDDFISPDNARRVWQDIRNRPPRPFTRLRRRDLRQRDRRRRGQRGRRDPLQLLRAPSARGSTWTAWS